jgi:NADPH-dependent glutamate synthase beta subunit-like oxidoreductase
VVLKIDDDSDIWSTSQSAKSDTKSDTKSDCKLDTNSDTNTQHKDVQTSPIFPPSEMEQSTYDVVIVGAGPAGLTLA